jgi:micrococcal nuclease
MFQYTAKILTVYDGDTCRADIDLGFGVTMRNQAFRVHGIDCPEMTSEAGKDARDHARTILTSGLIVRVETFKDSKEKYGRYLAKITLTTPTTPARWSPQDTPNHTSEEQENHESISRNLYWAFKECRGANRGRSRVSGRGIGVELQSPAC